MIEALYFASRDELKTAITSDDTRTWVEQFLAEAPWSFEDIVRRSVDGSTYRAFHTVGSGVRPSSTTTTVDR